MRQRGRMLITAGSTHERIDAVRYLANRSSGRVGVYLAAAAHTAGWSVTLLAGPDVPAPPKGVRTLTFESAADLAKRLAEEFCSCDVLIMAAAVADYRPRRVSRGKLPRRAGRLVLELEPTPDLVAHCAVHKRAEQRIVGFALEEAHAVVRRAQQKLRKKGLDAIVGNPLKTMGSDRIQAVVYTAAGETVWPPSRGASGLSKAAFARWLIRWIGADLMAPRV